MNSDARLASLQTHLEAYFQAIGQQREPNPPSLIPHFRQLDAWQAEHRDITPPQLRHYLQQKSYQKALSFLKGEEPEE